MPLRLVDWHPRMQNGGARSSEWISSDGSSSTLLSVLLSVLGVRTDGQALLLRNPLDRTHRDDGDIKAAFRKQAMVCHPDRNPGDNDAEHRFKEINEAYEVLKDPDKRAAYDRFGHAAFEHGMGGSGAGFGADFGTTFSDLFEGIFGMAGARRQHRGGRERGPIYATIWKSASLRLSPARMRKSAFRRR